MAVISTWVVALVLAVASSFPLRADGSLHPCGDAFLIRTPAAELGVEICAILTDAAERMAACGLQQTRPLTVDVVATIAHPIGECLSYFDCASDTIRVTDPGAFAETLTADDPYARLPPPILLRALLTHELAHALVQQGAGGYQVDIAAQEYVAAALELEFLPPAWRQVLLAASPVSLPAKPGLIDIWIYGLAPRKFATNAWQHFRQDGNGCGLILRIVDGEVSFR